MVIFGLSKMCCFTDCRVAEPKQLYCAFACQLRMFANVPLVTQISFGLPEQSNRQEIFSFVEQELLELESLLPASGSNEYGRVDQVAASALLTRIYLNAEVYIGQNRYADVISKADAVMGSTYAINTNDANNNGTAYDELFLADNHMNGAQNEFIFTLVYDGLNSLREIWYTLPWWKKDPVCQAGLVHFGRKPPMKISNADGHPTAWSDARAMFYTDIRIMKLSISALWLCSDKVQKPRFSGNA